MKATLEQWRAFVAVAEAGGHARAAQRLHRSQSAVSHALAQLQQRLGVALFRRQGRRAVLTQAGAVLLEHARALLDEARRVEAGAEALAAGGQARLTLVADIVFPTWRLHECLAALGRSHPETRIDLVEAVLGGTDEALLARSCDLALTTWVPPGFEGEELARFRVVPAAAPDHPLHRLGRPLTLRDLRAHRQLVVRDSAVARKRDSGGWFGAEQRWTVSQKATSIAAACAGHGFAWFPEPMVRRELDAGLLRELPLRGVPERTVSIHLVLTDPEFAGPATRTLAGLLREAAADLV